MIHLVRPDALIPKILVWNPRSACLRCDAYVKVEKHVKSLTSTLYVFFLNCIGAETSIFVVSSSMSMICAKYTFFFEKSSIKVHHTFPCIPKGRRNEDHRGVLNSVKLHVQI